ncbi:MAG: sodium:proline symporter, partial [Cyanobacteria bacterium PR.3.49]|nr:sodium:proline symporter [Cyanobacteria bacterium PR.3.49]
HEKSSDSGSESVKTVRLFTYVFAALMIVVAAATAYFVIEHPESRIIPIVLGIFGYTYGSLLGIFLLGLLTKNRGSDTGNIIAMCVGFLSVATFSGLPDQLSHIFPNIPVPPNIAFPFRILLGSMATFGCACLFSSKRRSEKR